MKKKTRTSQRIDEEKKQGQTALEKRKKRRKKERKERKANEIKKTDIK